MGSFDSTRASSSSSSSGYATSATAVTRTPGAPYMGTVPLPSTHGLMTPPASPPATRHAQTSLCIHPILRSPPAVLYNVLYPVSSIQLRPPYALSDPATHPAITRLSLAVALFPVWTVTVENPIGVTVHDVLAHLERCLHASVGRAEWEAQSAPLREQATAAFNKRTSGNETARQAGVRRVDFLGDGVVFAGMAPSRGVPGSWEVHFVAQGQQRH
ncbi:hypothetical protein NEOLEDRAFT_1079541 [Neolentinus lepideus HHB14362 ss-1]|uniref:DUF6699 domain-containing protein n=1 Tax=Neolentinus lepideus HHB14362 ss-1 TaxID=1314782 RepID=A0A165MRG6_9AGAM|nr:hypothetical protein NEOLEDRAFT_1079541 [Neolentinus lepideus HHB14362 ss-1]